MSEAEFFEWLGVLQRWMFRRELRRVLGDLLELRAYAYDSRPPR